MQTFACALGLFTLVLVFQEILSPVEAVRVRVVKVKRTRHDKRQATQGYPDADQGYDSPGTQIVRPQDNPYNAGNRKVDYPLNTNVNRAGGNSGIGSNRPNTQFSNNDNNNFGGGFNNNNQQKVNRRPTSQSSGGHDDGSYDSSGDHCPGCGNGIPGEAGTDYPVFAALPKTNFDCKKQQWPGYYADLEARCQVFWICQKTQANAFLCPNGTVFNQQTFVCDWWFNVDCNLNAEYYSRNQYIYGGPGIDIFGNQIQIRPQQSVNVNVNRDSTRRPVTQTTSINSQAPFNNNNPATGTIGQTSFNNNPVFQSSFGTTPVRNVNSPASFTSPPAITTTSQRVQTGFQSGSGVSTPTTTDNNNFSQTTSITTGPSTQGNAGGTSNFNSRPTSAPYPDNNQSEGYVYSQGNTNNRPKHNRQAKSPKINSYLDDQAKDDSRYTVTASPTRTSYAYDNADVRTQNGYSSNNSPRTSSPSQNGYSTSGYSKTNQSPTSKPSSYSSQSQRTPSQSGYTNNNNQRKVNSSKNSQRPSGKHGYAQNNQQRPSSQTGYSSNQGSNQKRPVNHGGYSNNQGSNQSRPTSQGGYANNPRPNQQRPAAQSAYISTQGSNQQRPTNQGGYSTIGGQSLPAVNEERQPETQNSFLTQTSPRQVTPNDLDKAQTKTPVSFSARGPNQFYQASKNNPFLSNNQDQYSSPSINYSNHYTSTQPEISTNKRNVLDSDAEFEHVDQVTDDNFDEVFAFNFAKTIVPTKSSYKIQSRRAYDVTDTPVSVTTFRPPTSTSIQSPNAFLISKKSVNELSHRHEDPISFSQAPTTLRHQDPEVQTQTPAPTFGKKIKSGRKRNTSNWTSYFYKN